MSYKCFLIEKGGNILNIHNQWRFIMNSKVTFKIIISIIIFVLITIHFNQIILDQNKPDDNYSYRSFEKNLNLEIRSNAFEYHNYSYLVNWLQTLNTTYPNLVEISTAQTLFGLPDCRDGYKIWIVRLTNESITSTKPELLYIGGHHGNEDVSIEVTPDTLRKSHWIPLPYLLVIKGEGTHFKVFKTKLEFEPEGAVLPLWPLVWSETSIWSIILVMPSFLEGEEDQIVTVTVNTESEVVSDEFLIKLPSFR